MVSFSEEGGNSRRASRSHSDWKGWETEPRSQPVRRLCGSREGGRSTFMMSLTIRSSSGKARSSSPSGSYIANSQRVTMPDSSSLFPCRQRRNENGKEEERIAQHHQQLSQPFMIDPQTRPLPKRHSLVIIPLFTIPSLPPPSPTVLVPSLFFIARSLPFPSPSSTPLLPNLSTPSRIHKDVQTLEERREGNGSVAVQAVGVDFSVICCGRRRWRGGCGVGVYGETDGVCRGEGEGVGGE
jgi:hypothetical protein